MRIVSVFPILASLLCSIIVPAKGDRPNILMIAVDDLRTELGCYGESHIVSPNIDRLAASGLRFDRAYCMVPTCGASRASLFSGRRPSPDRFVRYTARIDEDSPQSIGLHQYLKRAGYRTASLGKILHYPADQSDGWSESPWRPDRSEPTITEPILGWTEPANINALLKQSRNKRLPFASFDAEDEALGDGKVAAEAVRRIKTFAKSEEPFFLAVGFFKPHLPFNAPKKYWDLYDKLPIDLPDNYYPPEDAPKEAIHNFGELRNYGGVPKSGPIPDAMARTLIRGYYACVSYTDAQIGKVLDALDAEGLADNTIVILWGDHGWNLGEHTLWCKHCTFENAMQAPLIIRSPVHRSSSQGSTTKTLAEFIDIYPTLCDLAGIKPPSGLDGQSLVPTLENPADPGKGFAIGRFRDGDTIRTDRWRYTEYSSEESSGRLKIVARMLYDHDRDPDENRNLANLPEYASIITELSKQLNAQKGR
ncbi:MAG TPA: iduronate sulfatase [Opitutae bacterium]|nr:iduronate sulfatase [Opitutaceae bacterium]HCR29760.1 iduronate sulfatase [Opitutae bacterium]